MSNVIVVGAYWGDEGKGKIVDFLSKDADWTVRYNGGDNAGHTIRVGDKKYALHLLPSGLIAGKRLAIGPGVLINPLTLLAELRQAEEWGFSPDLAIDARANVIMPYHIELDGAREGTQAAVGSTKKGIGPCMEDAAARKSAITIGTLISDSFGKHLAQVLTIKKAQLAQQGITDLAQYQQELVVQLEDARARIKQYVIDDLSYTLSSAANVLIEGAQGTLLDLWHGTKPYQTATPTTAEAAGSALGIDSRKFRKILVAKAYPSRVGAGPFPTELGTDEQTAREAKGSLTPQEEQQALQGDEYLLGKLIRTRAHEYGTTTGRARRVGYPDAVALAYAARINGMGSEDGIALTLADVLSGVPLKVAIAYEKDGKARETFPANLDGWQPVYTQELRFEFADIPALIEKGYDALPEQFKQYCKVLVQKTGVPIEIISLGPRRDETLIKDVRERTVEYLK